MWFGWNPAKHTQPFCSLTRRRCVLAISRSTFHLFQIKLDHFKKSSVENSQNFWSKKIAEVEKFSKNRKIENFENRFFSEGFQLKFFEKSKIRKFQNSKIRKISIEILRKNFDFQNCRFFDFSKLFQLRLFFFDQNLCDFFTEYFFKPL